MMILSYYQIDNNIDQILMQQLLAEIFSENDLRPNGDLNPKPPSPNSTT